MSLRLDVIRVCGTFFLVTGNFSTALFLYKHPSHAVPMISLFFSMTGSFFWMLFAILQSDYFLLVSSTANVLFQVFSISIRCRKHFCNTDNANTEDIEIINLQKSIKEDTSTSSLPSIPPL